MVLSTTPSIPLGKSCVVFVALQLPAGRFAGFPWPYESTVSRRTVEDKILCGLCKSSCQGNPHWLPSRVEYLDVGIPLSSVRELEKGEGVHRPFY